VSLDRALLRLTSPTGIAPSPRSVFGAPGGGRSKPVLRLLPLRGDDRLRGPWRHAKARRIKTWRHPGPLGERGLTGEVRIPARSVS
jgi:hypothetical protein